MTVSVAISVITIIAALLIMAGEAVLSSFNERLLRGRGAVEPEGDVIGAIGKTGRATGPHLCLRLNWFQERLDPALVLPAA